MRHPFDRDISGWNVSSVEYMSSMFIGAASFEQNLGKWYVTVDGTSIAAADVPGIVGTISAQNAFLDDQDPAYGIGAGADSEHFAVVGEDQLVMASLDGARTYDVNVTASGQAVFEDGNNWETVTIDVRGTAPSTPLVVDAGSPQSVDEGETVTLTGTATGASPRFPYVPVEPDLARGSAGTAWRLCGTDSHV